MSILFWVPCFLNSDLRPQLRIAESAWLPKSIFKNQKSNEKISLQFLLFEILNQSKILGLLAIKKNQEVHVETTKVLALR